MVDVLIGLQWGDEGKGKIVDFLASQYDVIARFQGGPNAGHTLYVDGKKIVLRTIPSGVFHKGKLNLIGNGVVIDPVTLKEEIEGLIEFGVDLSETLFIAHKAHLILPTHRALDAASEQAKGKSKIGSTLKGIGPTYMDKTGRNGLRVGDVLTKDWKERYTKLRDKHVGILASYEELVEWEEWEPAFFEAIEFLQKLNIVNGEYWINKHIKNGKKVLAEGAQGSLLDVDYGTYPFVTSSNTTAAGVCTGLGVSPSKIGEVYGITKAYCTRVGGGPFPTELHDEMGDALRKAGNEFGAVTKRPRRCGWIDLVALKYAVMLSGVSRLIVTKTDVMDEFETIEAAVAYEVEGEITEDVPFDFSDESITPVYKSFPGWKETPISHVLDIKDAPETLIDYVDFLENFLDTKVQFVSNGPGREQLLKLF
ncbi:MAG TPA: adenylosuccinate synthase [Chitinophagaceae bacterium]|nr:adenylosuccinate synthase [Chitinophagaceae bacterium]